LIKYTHKYIITMAASAVPKTTNIKHIIHIADIHIGSSPSRGAEYKIIFDRLKARIAAYPPGTTLIVIAGDIFHNKVRYSGDDVALFNYLMFALSAYKVIIIPGNHDCDNLYNHDNENLISPVIDQRYPNVLFWPKSGAYEYAGLKFIHISVFDNSDTGAIAKLTAQFPDAIGLYHGEVNGTKYGTHTCHSSRITRELLDSLPMWILGDIHERQFVTPRAAYSGSLIQQNMSETPNKGGLIWNLTTLTAEPFDLHNDYSLIKIDLCGKSAAEMDVAIANMVKSPHIVKLTIVTDYTDQSMIAAQIDAIRTKFGRIDQIKTKKTRRAGIPAPEATGGLELAAIDVSESLREILTANHGEAATGTFRLRPEEIEEIITDYKSQAIVHRCKKWRLKSMRWSNYFKYGEDNYIDFTSLNDGAISGVIAANGAGKSSIFDILILGLFNELLRGSRIRAIRIGAKTAEMRIDFSVNGENYYVYRQDTPTTTRPSVIRILTAAQGEVAYQILTDETATRTYQKMRELIGTSSQFMATGLYYGGRHDLLAMSNKERMAALSELYGLSGNDDLLTKIKTSITAIGRQIKDLVKPISSVTPDDLMTAMAELEHLEAINKAHEADKMRYTKDLDHLRTITYPDLGAARKEIKLKKAEVVRLQLAVAEYKDLPRSADVVPWAEEVELDDGETASELRASLADALAVEPPMAVAKPKASPPSRETEKDIIHAIDKITHELADISASCVMPNDSMELAAARSARDTIAAKINALGAPHKINHKYYAALDSRVNELKSKSKYKFETDSCTACAHNIAQMNSELAEALIQASAGVEEKQRMEAENKVIENARVRYDRRLAAATDRLRELEAIAAAHARKASLEADLANQTARLTQFADAKEYAKYMANKQKYDAAQAEAKVIGAKLAWLSYSAYVNHNVYRENKSALKNTQKILEALEEDMAAQETREAERLITTTQIADLTAKIRTITSAQLATAAQIGAIRAKLEALRSNLAIAATYDAAYPILEAKRNRMTALRDALDSKGLQHLITVKNIKQTLHLANAILAQFKSADGEFRITVGESMETEPVIDLCITEYENNQIVRVLPVEMGSTFQRFIIELVIRLALTSSLPSAPTFVFIDEGFGCMDRNNLGKMIDVFAFMRDYYDFIFMISHVDAMNSAIERPMLIARKDGASQVLFGILPPGKLSDSRRLTAEPKAAAEPKAGAEPKAATVPGINVPGANKIKKCVICGAMYKMAAEATHMATHEAQGGPNVPLPVAKTAPIEKIKCIVCGSKYNKSGQGAHLRTKKHLAAAALAPEAP